jgi:hypothetical protein
MKARTIMGKKENLAIWNNFNIKSRNEDLSLLKKIIEVYIDKTNT